MEIEDLRKFLVVARYNHLPQAAEQLNVTTGALSKAIKRLEQQLQTPLFDRVGRHIRLNDDGTRFQLHARQLVAESDQVLSEYRGNQKDRGRVAGPSILLQRWLPVLSQQFPRMEFSSLSVWEQEAKALVRKGEADMALVTGQVASEGLAELHLGTVQSKVMASGSHPLWREYHQGAVTTAQLQAFGFACPSVSLYGGNRLGVAADGWRDDSIRRRIQFRCDDFSVLLALLVSGQALAYLPDFVGEQYQLNTIHVTDCPYICEDAIRLVYAPTKAHGWLNRLVDQLAQTLTASN